MEVHEDILVHGNCFFATLEEKLGKDVGAIDFHKASNATKSQ